MQIKKLYLKIAETISHWHLKGKQRGDQKQAMDQAKTIIVQGRVQGVGFRYSTRAKAESLNIKGFVKNMPDGSVHIEATGDADSMQSFVSWCHEGPPLARVTDVIIEEASPSVSNDFRIR